MVFPVGGGRVLKERSFLGVVLNVGTGRAPAGSPSRTHISITVKPMTVPCLPALRSSTRLPLPLLSMGVGLSRQTGHPVTLFIDHLLFCDLPMRRSTPSCRWTGRISAVVAVGGEGTVVIVDFTRSIIRTGDVVAEVSISAILAGRGLLVPSQLPRPSFLHEGVAAVMRRVPHGRGSVLLAGFTPFGLALVDSRDTWHLPALARLPVCLLRSLTCPPASYAQGVEGEFTCAS